MPSVNRVTLIGYLGKDPVISYLKDESMVCNVTLATTESWRDANGDKQEKTEWHRVTFYRKLAEITNEYLKKGAMVYVEGKLKTRKWTDKEGVERYTTEIIANEMKILDKKDKSAQGSGTATRPDKPSNDNFDDEDFPDIPF